MEDAAIAFGYNNIKKVYPSICTVAKEQFNTRLSDKIRNFVAQCGFTETLSFIVCPLDDLSIRMNNPTAADSVVKIDSNYDLNVIFIV